MATSYTSLWRLAAMQALDPAVKNSWGTIQNATMPLMEQGAVGITAVNIAGLTTYSLTTANNATDQARFLVQQYTGALTGNCTVTIPNLQKIGYAQNATTGGRNVILSAGAGTTVTLPPDSQWYLFWADGATNVALVPVGLNFTNISASGNITAGGNVTASGNISATGSVSGTVFVPTSAAPPTYGLYGSAAGVGISTGGIGRLTFDSLGAASFTTSLTISGAGGLNVSTGNSFVQGNSTTQGYMQVNGTNNAVGQSGWFYAPNGNGPSSPASQPYGISATYPVLSSGFFANSDVRVKSDIRPISPEEGAAFVELASPKRYRKQGREEAGFLAQDQVRAGYGELVMVAPNEALPELIDDDGLISHAGVELSLNYDNYVAYLVAAVQHLLAANKALKGRMAALEGRA